MRLTPIGVLLPLLGGCASTKWDEAELRRINAIDAAFARELPRRVVEKDVGGLRAMHGPEAAASSPILRAVESFQTVEDARLWIRDRILDREDPERSTLVSILRVCGLQPGGTRATVEIPLEMDVGEELGRWTILRIRSGAGREWRSPAAHFADVTEASGLLAAGAPMAAPPPGTAEAGRFTLGVGGAVIDFDQDGLEDLLLGTSRGVELWRNLGGLRFAKVEGWTALPEDGTLATGVCAADLDNDGRVDAVVGRFGATPRLLRNEGNGTFADVTARANLPRLGHPTSIAAGDYDRDGDLDLYVGCLGNFLEASPWPLHNARNGERNRLLRNEGFFRFTDVSEAAGLDDPRWTHAVAWADLDLDGWPDLYVANDFSTNALYRNRRDGTFEDVAEDLGAENRGNGMGVDLGDLDGDLRPDVYVSEMYSPVAWMATSPGWPLPVPWYMRWERIRPLVVRSFREMLSGNALILQQPDGTFRLQPEERGGRIAGWAWGCNLLDADNDGDLDVYVANGQYSGDTPDIGAWLFESVGTLEQQMRGFATGDLHLLATAAGLDGERLRREGKRVTLHGGERKPLFLNDGAGRLVDAGYNFGVDRPEDGRAVLVLDADNDGRPDLFLRNWMAPPVLLHNRTPPRHWLAVRLVGTASNRQGIGAKVFVRSGERRQVREARSGSGYLSTSSPLLHFGLDRATCVEELEIVWPSGRTQVLRDLPVDRKVTVTEGAEPASAE
ncbi:MAG: CRTAC1 family protein [Planctomycetes bacterium]|nr:CRTAC1 family protein [Planctomycetota bacterium]